MASRLHCTVREAQRRVNSREFTRWRAFDRIHPLPERRIDIAAARIVSAILAAGGVDADPNDHLTDYAAAFRPALTEEEEDAALAAKINAEFGKLAAAPE